MYFKYSECRTLGKKYRATLIRYIWRADDGSLSTVQHMLPFSPALAGKLLKPFDGGCDGRASLSLLESNMKIDGSSDTYLKNIHVNIKIDA